MENTQQQKTPEQWFKKLKEPYRSEAIANIVNKEAKIDSIDDAILKGFEWDKTKQRYEYWEQIHKSLSIGETTYLKPETLTPEQMESGKWYVVDTFLIKFKIISNDKIYRYKCYELQTRCDYSNNPDGFIEIQNNDIIRPATKEEVLKYFPDEVFEPIELKIDDLEFNKSYKYIEGDYYTLFTFKGFYQNESYTLIQYYKKLDKDGCVLINGDFTRDMGSKIYHATPEEKKLLLGEETPHYTNLEELSKDYNNLHKTYSDLMAKYEELQDNYEKMELSYVNSIETQDAKYDALADRYTKLEAYNDELTERINQTETKNNQEKVYFYRYRDMENIDYTTILEIAITNSDDEQLIYEAICIGKKKSVLVSE